MREVLVNFREWHANHFGDFDPETNAELLCLDNDAEAALRGPSAILRWFKALIGCRPSCIRRWAKAIVT